MDEPTAGIDIGAKGEIVTMIRDLANSGKGIIVISSELPELLAVSDRIVVLRDGSLAVVSPIQNERAGRYGFTWWRLVAP